MKKSLILLITSAAAAGGMNLHSLKDDPAKELLPESFAGAPEGDFTNSCWWSEFSSDELSRLIDRALQDNLSISRTAARMRQANASAIQAGAGKVPSVTANASATVTENEIPVIEGGDTRTESYDLLLSAAYEVDLWGRIAAAGKAARLSAEASAEDLQAMKQSVAAETASAYFELVFTKGSIDILNHQAATLEDMLDLIELRYRRSEATALDVLQQREQLAAVEALIPPLEAREAVLVNRLSVLIGLSPGSDLELQARALPKVPGVPPTGLPVQLVERRPDIRAAYFRLLSAHQGLMTAKADRLPAIRLTASAGYSNSELSDILDNWLARLVAGIAAPIVDGGKRRAEVDRTMAVMDERAADYKSVVLNAVTEVRNAMIQEEKQAQYIDAVEKQRNAAERSYTQASLRYQRGSEPYINALRELSGLQSLERQKLKAEFDRAVYRINLYKALAGSFNENKEE